MNPKDFCLRPNFTLKIFEKLKNGDSINLIGKEGIGRSRLLEDVKKLAKTEDIVILIVDLKSCFYNSKSFKKQFYQQVKEQLPHRLSIEKDDTPNTVEPPYLSLILQDPIFENQHLSTHN